jgi:hypothetical protein
MVVSLVIVLVVLAGAGFVYESLFGSTIGLLAYFAGRWRDSEGREALEHRSRLIADRCYELERELVASGEYAHRLLEDRPFYREQTALALETADLRLRGDFGLYSPEVRGRLLP